MDTMSGGDIPCRVDDCITVTATISSTSTGPFTGFEGLIVLAGQKGTQNFKSTEFIDLSDEQVDSELKKARRQGDTQRAKKLQREQKARRQRNVQKRKGPRSFNPFLPLTDDVIQFFMLDFRCTFSNPSADSCSEV